MKERNSTGHYMKYIAILTLLFSTHAFSIMSNTWDKLEPGNRYKLNQNLNFKTSNQKISFKKGTRLKLVESTSLNMIKVQLQRYEIDGCKNQNIQTDLAFVPINGDEQKAVGINLSKGCILEVFVEKKNLQNESLVL